ncbi:MAG: putative hydro-lyase [Clostridiaceae bacterium]|nr:putative hydro-lyase [Clostridiaceae bacterium]
MKNGIEKMNAKDIRNLIREGKINGPTAGMAKGSVQANLVILPKEQAFDFLVFCLRNPKPCPLLEVTDVGDWEPKRVAVGADIRTDIPKYRIYEYGELVGEVENIMDIWRDDFVAFLLGCSFSFENALINAGIPVRHIDEKCNVPMYITNIPCEPAGIFKGTMVVSMRPIRYTEIVKAVQVTSRFPAVHGAPVHIGSPKLIGIEDISKPSFGDSVTIRDDEVPVFWACGVTPQAVAMQAKPPLMITHAPGHMFITDLMDEDVASA